MATVPDNFLGLESTFSDYEESRFAILPIPYDATASFLAGTRHGPAAIIEASQQVDLFDEELEAAFYKAGIATLDPLAPERTGPEAMHESIFKAAKRVVRDGKFLFGLGGEHSITSGLVRAVMSKHRKLSVLQLDAHLDLRDSYEGSKYSHASVMRRVHEYGTTIVPVGIRNTAAEESRFLKRARISPVTVKQTLLDDDWIDQVLDSLGEKVYITLDIDGFDPAYAPGTGTPEPGGMDWHQVTALLRLVAAEKTVVGADVVEVMPIPGQVVTEYLAARLAYKLICYVQAKT